MADQNSGQSLFAMLQRLRNEGRLLPLEDTVYLIRESAALIEKNNGFNGDLTPLNIFVSDKNQIKFVTAESSDKIRYMSPERAAGEPPTPSANIFSLGMILWRLIFGRDIFSSGSSTDVEKRLKEFEMPQFPAGRKIESELSRAFEKMLAATPNERASAKEITAELSMFLKKLKPGYKPNFVHVVEEDSYKGILSGDREIDLGPVNVHHMPLAWKRWAFLFLLILGGAAYHYHSILQQHGVLGVAHKIKDDVAQIAAVGQESVQKITDGKILQPQPTNSARVAGQADGTLTIAGKSPSELVAVKIDSVPSGAAVWVGSRETTYVTPAVIEVPPQPSLTISLVRNGYRPCTALVSPKVGYFKCQLTKIRKN